MRLPRLTLLRCMSLLAVPAVVLGLWFDRGMIGILPASLLVILVVSSMPRRDGRLPILATLGVVAAGLIVPFLLSVLLSLAVWGYGLRPPSVDRRILDARLVRSVSFARTQAYSNGDTALIFDPLGSVAQAAESARVDPFQQRVARALVALQERKRVPENPKRAEARRSLDLYRVLEASGGLVTGKTAFVNAKDLRGIVIEADGADGSPLVFLAARGGEVSDGRHPFYEFLCSGSLDGSPLVLLSTTRFFFDVGNLAGVGLPEFLAIFLTLELLLTASALFLVRRKRSIPVTDSRSALPTNDNNL